MFYVIFAAIAVVAAWFVYSRRAPSAAGNPTAGTANPVSGGATPGKQPILNR